MSEKKSLKSSSNPRKLSFPVAPIIPSKSLGIDLLISVNSFLPNPKEEAIVKPVLAKPKIAGVAPTKVLLIESRTSLFCSNPDAPPKSGIALNTAFVFARLDNEPTNPPTEPCNILIPAGS